MSSYCRAKIAAVALVTVTMAVVITASYITVKLTSIDLPSGKVNNIMELII